MTDLAYSIRQQARLTRNIAFLLGGAFALWTMLTRLDGAVVTGGTVMVETNVKKVQHPTGGVVGALNVREGQRVEEGEVLVRLDDTVTRANLGIVANEMTAARARLARLLAETMNQTAISFPAELLERQKFEPDVAALIKSETALLQTRLTTRNGQKAQLVERVGQLRQETKALVEQQKSMVSQLKVARDELQGLRGLEALRLVPRPRITALDREIARNDGQLGEYVARVSQTQGRIAETELQILQLDKDAATEVAKDLREIETKINELTERKVAADDQLKRVDIRAPISGVVHQLAVHTVGGVVNQTEPLMLIVPESARLIVEVRINPQDIDQVRAGQPTRVRFTAFNSRVLTPEAKGTLFRVAGDITREAQTGATYYTGGVNLPSDELDKLQSQGMRLIPGMPAEAFIKTGARTVASYLLKPVTDQMQRAFRER